MKSFLMAFSFIVSAFCTLLFMVSASQAAESIGVFVETEGVVAVQQGDGEPQIAAVGDSVHLNDIIETAPESKALILFIDETELTLGENSRLQVDEYVFNAEQPNNKGRFNILRGIFIFVSGAINKGEDSDVKIETAYGSIGIRGTTVWGGPIDDEYSIFVADGEITFATKRGRVKLLTGQGTKVRSRDNIPDRPKIWPDTKVQRAVATVTLKDTDAVKQRIAEFKEKHSALRGKHKEGQIQRREERRENTKERQQIREEQKTQQNKRYIPERPRKETAETPQPSEEKATPDEGTETKTEAPIKPPAKEQIEEKQTEEKRIERNSNEAPEFERWEREHLKQERPRKPAAL